MLLRVITFGDKSMCATYTHVHTRNTRVNKTRVYYTKVSDSGETAIYVFSLFGAPVYIRVRYREKMRNMFTWLLDPQVERVGLTFEEVTSDGES